MIQRTTSFTFACVLATFATAQDPLVKQALGRIETVEQQEPKLTAGDTATANRLLGDLAWAKKRLDAVVKKDATHWQAAVDRLAAVRQKVEAKGKAATTPAAGGTPTTAVDAARLAQLDKEIGNALGNLRLLSTKHLDDDFRARSTSKEIEGLAQRLAAMPAEDASVKPVAARFTELRTLFDGHMAQLEKDRAALPALQKRLAELDAKYDAERLPGPLTLPFDEAQLRTWAAEIKRWRDRELPADLTFLGDAARNAVADAQHVARLTHWLTELRDRRIAEATRGLADALQRGVDEGAQLAAWILATDAKDRDQVQNRILGKGAFDGNLQRLRAGQDTLALARVHDELMAGKPDPARVAQAAQLDQAIAHLRQLAVATLDAVRMPAAASTDAELLRIAEETLKKPGYGVGAWQRLVVNTEKVKHERREAWVRGGAVAATVSYYHYVWEQFQVTTAEKVGDELWLFANTLKRYESGDPTTPVGRWILSQRFELTRILPENVAK